MPLNYPLEISGDFWRFQEIFRKSIFLFTYNRYAPKVPIGDFWRLLEILRDIQKITFLFTYILLTCSDRDESWHNFSLLGPLAILMSRFSYLEISRDFRRF